MYKTVAGERGKLTTVIVPDSVRAFWNTRGVAIASVVRLSVEWHEERMRLKEGVLSRDQRLVQIMQERDRLIDENRELRGFKARALERWKVQKGLDL